ncbi:hypothetical protein [Chimaeribacter arupi]|uniref:hypothetical protein n=1 Tax=Chimaeribacter arupi TaxID=2060066 RepID=UPI000C7A61F8|nr:hypothetical protein [Chimaeribacter arupi]MDV5142411.1 hypothetical protein [Chimaeribacter arupi]PLR35356.1 hypothetical protein CYR23_09310 [Chimaeribacter arupi]
MSDDFNAFLADSDKWDNRELGASEEHVQVVSEKAASGIDDQLGLQAISIRLPKTLIRELKEIAQRYGVGYQPMVRDLLNRFAQAEQKKYLLEQLRRLKAAESEQEDTAPVAEFIASLKKQG